MKRTYYLDKYNSKKNLGNNGTVAWNLFTTVY